jgi:hypothetical protein
MNPDTRIRISFRISPILLVGVLILATSACEKKKPPVEETQPTLDRVAAPPPVSATQTVLHKTFTVSTSVNFPFEIPAHAAMPHLHGNYKSFIKQLGVQSNDNSANVDFLILNEDQYADFVHGHQGEALFSAEASHDQDVSASLPATQDKARKYYLIFRNTPGGEARKIVQADFTVDF